MRVAIQISSKNKSAIYANKVNGDYSLDELCLVALINPDGIPTYADDMIGKVSSAERTEIIEKILNRDMKYYRHETEERWVLISDGDYEGGFFKGAVLSEADMNLTFKPYQVIDINWVQDIVVRTAEIVTLAYLFAASAAVVTENLAAFIGYVKLYGFSAGLKWYMQLGTSGFPDGALSWLTEAGAKDCCSINNLMPNQGFSTFNKLKNYIGSAGDGNDWHHIVEKSQINKSGFDPTLIHNTNNIISVDHYTHIKITAYYNTKSFPFTEGLSVRDWLAGKDFQTQYEFGLDILRNFGVIK